VTAVDEDALDVASMSAEDLRKEAAYRRAVEADLRASAGRIRDEAEEEDRAADQRGHEGRLLAAAADARQALDKARGELAGAKAHAEGTLLLMVIVAAVIARLARAVGLSRYFRLLLAALAYPYAVLLASRAFGWLWFNLTPQEQLALMFAGPVLTVAIALISAVRPRRRQII
jgi:hypothetical protein